MSGLHYTEIAKKICITNVFIYIRHKVTGILAKLIVLQFLNNSVNIFIYGQYNF